MNWKALRRLPALTGLAAIVALGVAGGSGGSVASGAASVATMGTVHVAKLSVGEDLVTESGRTVYVFSADAQKRPRCTGSCAKYWPPLLVTHAPTAGKGVVKGLLGTVKTANGKLQVTYNHWPLYTFILDKRPGQVHGQNLKQFGGVWDAIGAAGHSPFAHKAPPSTTTTTSPGSSWA